MIDTSTKGPLLIIAGQILYSISDIGSWANDSTFITLSQVSHQNPTVRLLSYAAVPSYVVSGLCTLC